MKYEKDLMASWDEYAIKKTIEHDRRTAMEKGREEGMGKGKEEKTYEFVKSLLSSDEFTIAKIANFANVSEAFVRKVKKDLK